MNNRRADDAAPHHAISIVIPVYGGEHTLAPLVAEIVPFTEFGTTPDGHHFRVEEIVLVHDNGRDNSPEVMRRLEAEYPSVRTVWLSRNYGQHAATLAGMESSTGEWIVTMDEDGQHDPAHIAQMLDIAMRDKASLVYLQPTNKPSHGFIRNATSRLAKWVLWTMVGGGNARDFQSYRLMLGTVGRGVADRSGANVYLDVALSWVAPAPSLASLPLRHEGERLSGYRTRTLISHFWRMVLTSGTRGLRLVSMMGAAFGLAGLALAAYILIQRIVGVSIPEGWASTMVVVLLGSGSVLVALGIIAEYIGVSVNMSLGKPRYFIVPDPRDGPLGRKRENEE